MNITTNPPIFIQGSNLTTLNSLGITSAGQTNVLSSVNTDTIFNQSIHQQHDIGAFFTSIVIAVGTGAATGAPLPVQ